MPPAQLKTTTMDPPTRALLRVMLPENDEPATAADGGTTARLVETLMGRKPELRFAYIQEHACFVDEIDV